MLRTKCERCICSVQLHFYFSIHLSLFCSCIPREKKDTRIVCRPTRKAAKPIIRSISCSLQLRLQSNESKKNGDKTLKWTYGYYNFFTPSERDFHSRKCSFYSRFGLSGLAQSTPQHDKQITVIRLHSSGTFCMHANFT